MLLYDTPTGKTSYFFIESLENVWLLFNFKKRFCRRSLNFREKKLLQRKKKILQDIFTKKDATCEN